MRLGALLVICCACGRLGFEARQGETVDGSLGDAPIGGDDGPPPDGTIAGGACTAPGNASTFPGGSACTDWGASPIDLGAATTELNNTLVVTPVPNTQGSQGGCLKTAVPFGAGGAIVEVAGVLAGANTLTAIQLGLGPTALSMVVSSGVLFAQDASGTLGMAMYNGSTMRFWRIRPAGNAIVFEYGDGTSWTPLGTSAQVPQAAYDYRVIAGELFAEANPGSAVFQSVNLCP